MKRYISVAALCLRRCLRPLILLLVVLFAAETAAFWLSLRVHAPEGLETVLEYSYIGLIAAAGFLLFCGWLFYIGNVFSVRQDYTLLRLSVTSLGGFFARWAAFAACFLILWGAQTAIALWLCFLYRRFGGHPELWSAQAPLLAFYRSPFLHALLPLRDTLVWVRNAIACLALGAGAAHMPAQKKFGGFPYLAILTVFWFRHALGSFVLDLFLIVLGLIVTAVELTRAAARGEEDEYAKTP